MGYKVERPDMSLLQNRSYLPALFAGLRTTTRHLVGALTRPGKNIATRQYPEVKRPYPPRFRGVHRLMHREDGEARCVACMCCSTACPAKCIEIEAGEHEDKRIEKYPVRFEIDLLLCVYCGNCEEACPCDAIRLDTGVHPTPTYVRGTQMRRKVDLLERGELSVAKQGGDI